MYTIDCQLDFVELIVIVNVGITDLQEAFAIAVWQLILAGYETDSD